MDAPGYEPTGWAGLVPWLLYAAPFIIPTALVWWGQHRAKENRKRDKPVLAEIHEQTVNSHKGKDNLRDQIDRLEAVVTDGFQQVQTQLNGLHEELRTERLERIAGDNRLNVNVHPTIEREV